MRTFRLAVPMVAAVMLLAACGPADERAATPSVTVAAPEVSHSPTPTPTLTPEVVQDALTCDTLRIEEAAAAIGSEVGERWMPFYEAEAAVVGGVSCLWLMPLLEVAVFPAGLTTGTDWQAGCNGWGYDFTACTDVRTVEGHWISVTVGDTDAVGSSASPEIASALADHIEARLAETGLPAPAPRTADWWDTPTCQELGAAVAWPWEIHPESGTPLEPGRSAARAVSEGAGSGLVCEWWGDDQFLPSATVVPGGAGAWDALTEAGEAVVVPGATEARRVAGSGNPWLAVTDGTNMFTLRVSGDPEGRTLVGAAEELLRALRA